MKFMIATHNAKKLKELARILNPLGIRAVTDTEEGLSLPEVEETGTTFAQNAFLKAESACKVSGLPAIADDSGLMVDALQGEPGVYSARYAGEDSTPEDCNRKLLAELTGVPAEKRTARFASSICCVFPNGKVLTAEGVCEGVIGTVPKGNGGFGYDPLFYVEGKSFAEMTSAEKDAVSHRGVALRLFAEKLKQTLEETTC